MAGGPRRELTRLDAAALIIGVIVGAGIFQVVPDVARGTPGPAAMLGLWLLGGVLSFCGAAVYAELAAAWPEVGGDYAFLSRAAGPWAGFLFAWLHAVVIRPGDIAVMAFAFATYAAPLVRELSGGRADLPEWVWAAGAVAALTAVHAAGVRTGTRTQNALTALKVGGLLAVIGLATAATPAAPPTAAPEPLPAAVALILVLFTYGGWNEIAFVAGEVRNPGHNIPRALALGLGTVTTLYVLANAAFLHARGGHAGVAASRAVAAEAAAGALPGASLWVSALIAVSALGAVHGLIFAGARVPFAAGRDHPLFRPLAAWNERCGAPAWALAFQGGLAVLLVVVLRSFVDTLLYTAAPVYLFYLATTLALPALRRRHPERPRPVRAPAWAVAAFAITCAYLAWRAVAYRPPIAAAALGLAALGWPLWRLSRRMGPAGSAQTAETE